MTIDLKFYLALFLRRFHYFALAFIAVVALAGTAALMLPPSYESSARLLLESPQIPDKLAAPTVTASDLEQLQVLQQRLMTRQNLLEIARKYNVFSKIDSMTPDDIVTAMTEATTIKNLTGRDAASMMTIGFQARSADVAAAVVNEYVTRLLNQSVTMRTGQAQQTLDFFKQEVDRLASDLSAQSAKILSFQNKNRGALPNTLNYRLTQQSTLQQRLASIEQQVADLQAQKQRLITLFNTTGQVSLQGSANQMTPDQKRLSDLRSQLAQASAVLSDTNPKIVMLKSQITQLEKVVKGQAAANADGTGSKSGGDNASASPQQSMLDIQTAQLDGQISQLQAQKKDIEKQLADLKTSIDATADNQVTLDALQRDYDNIQTQYNAAVARQSEASTGERMATLSKGQRLTVLDPATKPDAPTKPNRRKIFLLGVLGGIAAGLGLVLLRELLDTSMRRPADLTAALGVTPLATIPYIRSPGERARRRGVILGILLLVAVGVPASMWAVDTYYMPLDLLTAKISAKLGS